jgi:signal transduction histidine kinase
VAHELRNPLNVIKTSVYYLLHARNPTPEKTSEHLQRIEQQVGLADRVITTLVSFAKMPLPELQPTVIGELVSQVLQTCQLSGNIEAIIDCPDSLPPVLADPDQLRIVLGNLIRNARDAMPEGGQLKIVGRAAEDHVEVDVIDTGVGIPAEHLSQISEPLFSTKSRGLGLGLALVRSILDKNQGALRVSSELGHGSAFTVQLRAARKP